MPDLMYICTGAEVYRVKIVCACIDMPTNKLYV